MCLAAVCFWHVRKLKCCCCSTSNHLLWKNILNYFGWVEVRILEGMWNIYIWSTHFHEVISTKMLFGNDIFVFKYPFKGKRNTGFTFKLTFISSFRIAVPFTAFVNYFVFFRNFMQNSHFCGFNIAYMTFVNTGSLIQIYFS